MMLRDVDYPGTDLVCCCLGVLQLCVPGATEVEVGMNGKSYSAPSRGWLAKNGILFLEKDGNQDTVAPFLRSLDTSATIANDGIGYHSPAPFHVLANAIAAVMVEYTLEEPTK